MPRNGSVTEIDVSGGGFIDDRGRHVNTDIPREERGRGSKGKSNARKRLKQKQSQADKKKLEIQEEEESKKPGGKKKRKKKEDSNSLDLDREKDRKRKRKADKAKAADAEKEEGKKKKKKRKKKTVGELLDEGKTKQAQKKMARLSSKALTVADKTNTEVEVLDPIVMQSSGNSEADFLEEYNHIYSTLGSIIRKLEKRMADEESGVSSKDVYALMTMYSQMRETIADLRSIKDMNEQAEELAQQVFDPAAKSAGESLVNLYFKVSSSIRQKVDDPKIVEALTESLKIDVGEQAARLQDQFDVARGRIVDILNGGR